MNATQRNVVVRWRATSVTRRGARVRRAATLLLGDDDVVRMYMKRDRPLAKGHWATKGAGQTIATTWKPLLSRSRHDPESLAPQRGGTR